MGDIDGMRVAAALVLIALAGLQSDAISLDDSVVPLPVDEPDYLADIETLIDESALANKAASTGVSTAKADAQKAKQDASKAKKAAKKEADKAKEEGKKAEEDIKKAKEQKDKV